MSVKLLTEHHFEFLSLTGGCTGSSESTLVKMSNCWKSHAAAHFLVGIAVVNQFFKSSDDNLYTSIKSPLMSLCDNVDNFNSFNLFL